MRFLAPARPLLAAFGTAAALAHVVVAVHRPPAENKLLFDFTNNFSIKSSSGCEHKPAVYERAGLFLWVRFGNGRGFQVAGDVNLQVERVALSFLCADALT